MRWGSHGTTSDQFAHLVQVWTELIVVSCDNPQTEPFSQGKHLLGFTQIQRERFLDVDVASCLQALLSQLKMALGRRGNVYYIGAGFSQELIDIVETMCHLKTLGQLVGH